MWIGGGVIRLIIGANIAYILCTQVLYKFKCNTETIDVDQWSHLMIKGANPATRIYHGRSTTRDMSTMCRALKFTLSHSRLSTVERSLPGGAPAAGGKGRIAPPHWSRDSHRSSLAEWTSVAALGVLLQHRAKANVLTTAVQ